MLERLEHELQPDRVGSRLAFCQESEHQGARIGVFCRAALDPNRPGVSYIALLNMRPVEAHVHLKISDSLRVTCGNRYTDLLSGKKGSSEEMISLKANKFMLLMFSGGSAYSSSMPVHSAPPPALPQPESAKRVCIYDIRATNVPVQDEGKFGTSDPSLRLLMDGKRVIGQTEARYNTESPHWEEMFCFTFFSTVSAVSIEVHDDWPSESPTLLDSGAFYLERPMPSINPIVKHVLLSRGTVVEFSIQHPNAPPAEPDYSSVPPSRPLMPSPDHAPISPPTTPPSCPILSPPLNHSDELLQHSSSMLPNNVVNSSLGPPPELSPMMYSPSALTGISNQSVENDHGESAYQHNNRTSSEQIKFSTPDSFNSSISSTMLPFNIGAQHFWNVLLLFLLSFFFLFFCSLIRGEWNRRAASRGTRSTRAPCGRVITHRRHRRGSTTKGFGRLADEDQQLDTFSCSCAQSTGGDDVPVIANGDSSPRGS